MSAKEQWLKTVLKTGEQYAGIVIGKNGDPDHHLILLPAKPENTVKWDAAVAWAKEAGGQLPTRREQSLLFANLKEHFEGGWHWSGEQNDAYPSYAWVQYFHRGSQNYHHKSGEFRARAVRSILILE